MRSIRNIKGLTLVEVLIAMGIASAVGALLLVVIVNSAGLFYKESSKLSQGVDINASLNKFKDSVKGANSIAVSYQDGSITYVSGSSQLVLQVPSINESGAIPETFDYYVFFLDQNFLKFKSFPNDQSIRFSSDQILSSNVDSLVFIYYDSQSPPQETAPQNSSKIKMTLVLRQKSGADFEHSIATSEASLRND